MNNDHKLLTLSVKRVEQRRKFASHKDISTLNLNEVCMC
jgi:hypothetical protein